MRICMGMCLHVRGKLFLNLWSLKKKTVKVSLKSRKNFHPIHPPFSYLHHPFIISQTDYSSRLIHALTKTLPLTLKPNMAATLSFPTLTHFLGELEQHFHAHSQEITPISDYKHTHVRIFFSSFLGVCFSVDLWSPGLFTCRIQCKCACWWVISDFTL